MRDYFLESERVAFSCWEQTDDDLVFLLWGDEAVTRYTSKTGKFTESEILARLNLEIENEKKFRFQYWPIFEKESGEFIGCCGLRPCNAGARVYELGFHLRSKFWGKGIALEAARRVIQYAFDSLNADDIFAGHHPDNIGSKKVLVKLGFVYVGDEYYEPTGCYHCTYTLSRFFWR